MTSKSTSINKTRLPAVYNRLDWEALRESLRGRDILDYGCGRYTDHIKAFVEGEGFTYHGYDPYWSPECDPDRPYSMVICSNVLNVIDDDETMEAVHDRLEGMGIPYFITVYEGDGTGVGKQTGPDSFQRNAKTLTYARERERVKNKVLTKPLWSDMFVK